MFWEKFFYGCEELDYSYRLLDQGYRIIHSAAIIVAHREVQQARPKGQWFYFNVRNRCWLAWKNLPWPYALSMTLAWWGHACFTSLRYGLLGYFIKGMLDAVAGLPAVIRERQKISRETVTLLKTHSGRLWY
jgi:GT2 family glycosyltransferase